MLRDKGVFELIDKSKGFSSANWPGDLCEISCRGHMLWNRDDLPYSVHEYMSFDRGRWQHQLEDRHREGLQAAGSRLKRTSHEEYLRVTSPVYAHCMSLVL